jgi:aminoglycoside phosphotransferase (APT) family kinase protein
VYTRPDVLDDDDLRAAVRAGWRFDAADLRYAPVGFGSHHWVATEAHGGRRFLTVDDLERREFLGRDASTAFDALRTAFAVVTELRQLGLCWVAAPLADLEGEPLRWLGDRYSVALFPYLEGTTAPEYASPAERLAVVDLLAELHGCGESLRIRARSESFELPNRRDLTAALGALDEVWETGPFAESGRALLRDHAVEVSSALTAYDEGAAMALRDTSTWVLTHGEPHSGNVMRTSAGMRVIDWDTLLLAPPERDLWMLTDSAVDPAARRYSRATGHEVDPNLLQLYALWWDLCEIGIYVAEFRSEHAATEDTRVSWHGLQNSIEALPGRLP